MIIAWKGTVGLSSVLKDQILASENSWKCEANAVFQILWNTLAG
jgi:hypothetical protein